jgi:hypothetical protein
VLLHFSACSFWGNFAFVASYEDWKEREETNNWMGYPILHRGCIDTIYQYENTLCGLPLTAAN